MGKTGWSEYGLFGAHRNHLQLNKESRKHGEQIYDITVTVTVGRKKKRKRNRIKIDGKYWLVISE